MLNGKPGTPCLFRSAGGANAMSARELAIRTRPHEPPAEPCSTGIDGTTCKSIAVNRSSRSSSHEGEPRRRRVCSGFGKVRGRSVQARWQRDPAAITRHSALLWLPGRAEDHRVVQCPISKRRIPRSGAPAQPCGGFQPAAGMVLIIQGTPNLSMSEPKPGDQKVSLNGMTARPPAES